MPNSYKGRITMDEQETIVKVQLTNPDLPKPPKGWKWVSYNHIISYSAAEGCFTCSCKWKLDKENEDSYRLSGKITNMQNSS